jgi:hypothetical protein
MTAPAFIYTSEPWAAHSFGRPIFAPAFTSKRMRRIICPNPPLTSLHRRVLLILALDPVPRPAGAVGRYVFLRQPGIAEQSLFVSTRLKPLNLCD